MKVELQEVASLLALKFVINKCPLDKIEWVNNGEPVEVSQELIEEWKFVGLSNIDFAYNHLLPEIVV